MNAKLQIGLTKCGQYLVLEFTKTCCIFGKYAPSAQDLAKDTNEKRKRREFEKERQLSR
jgi:hypothetical protein